MERMQPTAYKIGGGERKGLSKDMQKIIVAYQEENKNLKEKIKRLEFDVDAWHQLKLLLEGEIKKLEEEKQAMKEEMKAMERTLDSLGYGERTY